MQTTFLSVGVKLPADQLTSPWSTVVISNRAYLQVVVSNVCIALKAACDVWGFSFDPFGRRLHLSLSSEVQGLILSVIWDRKAIDLCVLPSLGHVKWSKLGLAMPHGCQQRTQWTLKCLDSKHKGAG